MTSSRTRYRVLVADPPWPFSDKLPGKGRGSDKHYGTMSASAICAFPLPKLDDDCWLFLWRPATHAQEALHVARSWGFLRPPSELVWRKMTKDGKRLRIGMGRAFRNAHETCLVFRRGKPARLSMALSSIFDAPRGDHSSKPDRFYELVDEFAPGPKVELFARRQWRDWTCLGDEMVSDPIEVAAEPTAAGTVSISSGAGLVSVTADHLEQMNVGRRAIGMDEVTP